MGMAHKPPEKRYQRKLYVSHHAIERFRERVERARLQDFIALADGPLGNRLDELVQDGYKEGGNRIEHVLDQGVPGDVVELATTTPLFALVKPDTKDPARRSVVTVLTRHMVTELRADGRWVEADPEDWSAYQKVQDSLTRQGPATTSLEEKLKGVSVKLKPVSPTSSPGEVETRLITYVNATGRTISEEYPREEVGTRVEELMSTVGAQNVRVWKPVEVKTRTRIAVEVE